MDVYRQKTASGPPVSIARWEIFAGTCHFVRPESHLLSGTAFSYTTEWKDIPSVLQSSRAIREYKGELQLKLVYLSQFLC